MTDTVTLVGSGGVEHTFDLPLAPVFADQLERGLLREVDAPREPKKAPVKKAAEPPAED